MSNKENISEKELEQQAPVLFDLDKAELSAPAGYFEGLSSDIISKLETPLHQLSDWSNKPYLWKVAAGISILFGLYFLLQPPASHPSKELTAEGIEINLDEDMDYLLEIEDEIIYDMLAEQLLFEYEETLDPRIEYLLEEDIELDDIINL